VEKWQDRNHLKLNLEVFSLGPLAHLFLNQI